MQPKLLLIGVDGVRLDIVRKEGHAPNINRILDEGASTEMTMEVPTTSGPGWSSLLTGTTHAQHGVTDNTFLGNRLYECPDFLSRVAIAHPTMRTAAASSWPPLVDPAGPGPVIATRNDQIISCHHRLVVRDGETYGYRLADSDIARFAVVSTLKDPADASFVYLGEVDEAGHLYGGISKEYEAALSRVDAHVGAILDAVERRSADHPDEDWLVCVTTDHGHLDEGGHGGADPVLRRSFFGALRLGARADEQYAFDSMRPEQVAGWMLRHLDVPTR